MNRRDFIATAPLALAGGCAIFDHDDGPEYDYPSRYKGLFEQARKDAMARIESVDGQKPKLDTDVRGVVIKGQRYYGGWCWYSPEWNFWVGGLCYLENPIRPTVAENPKTGGQLNYSWLVEESAHGILWDWKGISDHPARYSKVFPGWVNPPRSRLLRAADGRVCVVDGFPVDEQHPAPEVP